MTNFMFDTNCFYRIKFEYIDLLEKDENNYFCTHIQKRELEEKEGLSEDHKSRLIKVFKLIKQEMIAVETGVIGDCFVLGQTRLGTAGYFDELKSDLDKLKTDKNNTEDALLVEVAIKGNIVFVTDEKDIIKIIEKHNSGSVMSFEKFKNNVLLIKTRTTISQIL